MREQGRFDTAEEAVFLASARASVENGEIWSTSGTWAASGGNPRHAVDSDAGGGDDVGFKELSPGHALIRLTAGQCYVEVIAGGGLGWRHGQCVDDIDSVGIAEVAVVASKRADGFRTDD